MWRDVLPQIHLGTDWVTDGEPSGWSPDAGVHRFKGRRQSG
jgi:hypothetical protein